MLSFSRLIRESFLVLIFQLLRLILCIFISKIVNVYDNYFKIILSVS